jgi:hypothetical protein
MLKRNVKATFKISVWLNLALLGGLIFILANQRKEGTGLAPILSAAKSSVPVASAPIPPTLPQRESKPLRWSQLESAKDYQVYIANLRAIGCPESTIEDIVRGDADRAFSWERKQLGLDGSGTGPWSRARELQLVAGLLGGQSATETTTLAQDTERPINRNNGDEVVPAPVASQDTKTGSPSYPLFLQNPDWSALGFTADQQAAIAQIRHQFQSAINSLNPNAGDTANQNGGTTSTGVSSSTLNLNDSSALTQWQQALQSADNQLRDLLGAQGYMAYEQQQYYAWYQPQVVAASAQGAPLTINPDAFSLK